MKSKEIIQAEFKEMSFHQYLKSPELSSGFLRNLSRSPAHAKHYAAHEVDSPALMMGRALHCAVLEPGEYGRRYAVVPECDKRTKEGKALYQAFLAATEDGTDLLTGDDDARIRGMSQALHAHGIVHQMLFQTSRKTEQSIFWNEGDIPSKMRLDCLTTFYDSPIALDLKTCRDAARFERSVIDYGYHIQQAWYQRGLKAAGVKARFLFVAVESAAPFGVRVVEIDDELIEHANNEIDENLKTFTKCKAYDSWPAYPEEISIMPMPAWMSDRNEDLIEEESVNATA